MSKLEKFLTIGNRQVVINHLKKMRNPAKIVHALRHEDWQVQTTAMRALARQGRASAPFAPKIRDAITENLFTENIPVAFSALSQMGPEAAPSAVKIIEETLRKRRSVITHWEGFSHTEIGELFSQFGPKAAPHFALLLNGSDLDAVELAAKVLAKIGTPIEKEKLWEKIQELRKSKKDTLETKVALKMAIDEIDKRYPSASS
ncbi:MAG TPA: hypothetical protein VGQ00_00990 [Candidatus Norongarragalinales archaeon]|jgi:hypothetical protein|nr:hypothetical protein [Candidatus Norongarragalinales archaeon]